MSMELGMIVKMVTMLEWELVFVHVTLLGVDIAFEVAHLVAIEVG